MYLKFQTYRQVIVGNRYVYLTQEIISCLSKEKKQNTNGINLYP